MARRQDTRYRVHLQVRYGRALEFVQDYAENLSKGGLFIRDAHNLSRGQEVTVEVDVPGYGTFRVVGEVVHVLSPDRAAAMGRRPGAGLAITRAPRHYRKALYEYLMLLGARRDCIVFAEDPDVLHALQEAGYGATPMPPVAQAETALTAVERPILGVILSPDAVARYAPALFAANLADRVHQITYLEELDDLIQTLDERIAQP